jgi:ABC-2 type transport system ATP-binding protein
MTAALSIHNLRKTYKNGFEALKGIDLEVQAGDFFALLGPNGAGKSTTIGIITSLINKSSGTVEVYGCDIDKDFSAAKRHIGVVPQEFNFNVFEPIVEVVVNQAGYYGLEPKLARERAEHYLNQLGLWSKRNDSARELSGGMKRRLMIARALVHEPELLILDEPTAGVDIEIRRSMWDFLRKMNDAGKTIILTTHYLEEAEQLCRNIAIIDEGQLVANTSMEEILGQLAYECFVFSMKDKLTVAPTLEGVHTQLIDARNLQVEVPRGASLNGLFQQFTQHGMEVAAMRNKANRLEQLFLHLTADETESGGS